MAKREGKTDYECETQQNLMKVVEYLATDIFKPTGVNDICAALGMTYNQANWSLHNLKLRGWAEQAGGGWVLDPRVAMIAEKVRKGLAEATRRYLGE